MFLEGILKSVHVSIRWKRGVVTNQWFGQWSGEGDHWKGAILVEVRYRKTSS
jgi:hypothetical protein